MPGLGLGLGPPSQVHGPAGRCLGPPSQGQAGQAGRRGSSGRGRGRAAPRCSQKGAGKENSEPGLGLKAVWYGAEQLGNVIGLGRPRSRQDRAGGGAVKLSREEVLARIRADYEEQYFVSGRGDMAAYSPDCYFADPFAGFSGTQRFKNNVSNLGGLLQDVQLELLDWQEEGPELRTRWRFSGVLQLPWRPRLAAAGSTRHVFATDSGRVVEHIEAWDVEPGAVVRSLLRPSARTPTNRWEEAFAALDRGRWGAFFGAATPLWAALAGPIVAWSLVVKLSTGEGLQGLFLGAVEGLAYTLLLAAGGAEAWRALQRKGGPG